MGSPAKVGLLLQMPIERAGVALLINSFPEYTVSFETSDFNELEQKLSSKNIPDLLLVGFEISLFEFLKRLKWCKDNFPDLPIIILTEKEVDIILVDLMYSGVRSIIKKQFNPVQLQKALNGVMEQGYHYTDQVTRNLLLSVYGKSSEMRIFPQVKLSEREHLFLHLAATDLTYHQMSHMMKSTIRSIDKMRDRLFEKFNVKNRTALTMHCLRSGILDYRLDRQTSSQVA